MSTGLAERLLTVSNMINMGEKIRWGEETVLMDEAAARIKALESALKPFAVYMENGGDLDNKGQPLPDDQGVGWVYLNMGDFRRASAALPPQPSEVDGHKPS